jgi:hypothetical protein
VKVLVATSQGQGGRPYDVCTTVEGELVLLHRCDRNCMVCRRTMIGLASGGVTTTFMIADLPDLDRDLYRSFVRGGLDSYGCDWCRARLDRHWLDERVDELIEAAADGRAEAVYGRFDGELFLREMIGEPRALW